MTGLSLTEFVSITIKQPGFELLYESNIQADIVKRGSFSTDSIATIVQKRSAA